MGPVPRPNAPAAAGARSAAIVAAIVALCAAFVIGGPARAQGPPMGSPGGPPSGAPPTGASPSSPPPTGATAFRPAVASVRFFETAYTMTPRESRGYTTWFRRVDARYIGWEISLSHPAPGRRVDFSIAQVWSRDDGTVVARQTLRTHVEATWANSYHNQSWGWRDAGNWRSGVYRVDFSLDGQRLANGSFKVFVPSAAAADLFNRGGQLVRANRHRDALPYFDRAIRLHPDYATAYTNRCFARAVLGEYEAAMPDCDRALQINAADASTYYDRGTIHVARQRYAAGIADLTRAIQIGARDGGAHANRAAAYYATGDHERAWADVRRAQALGYTVPPSLIEKLERATGARPR